MDIEISLLLGIDPIGKIVKIPSGKILKKIVDVKDAEISGVILDDGTCIPKENYLLYEIVERSY